MSTITLPNIRVSSDLEIRLKLKDGGVAIDWSTLTNIKASIYSDRQRSLAGRCDIAIDEEDSTILVCRYSANKPQYPGVNRVIVCCTYDGETKTYDKPAFTFVRWTDDQAGQSITIDDPDIDVEITVEDISSSILQEAVEAANSAAERANDAAAAAEHMVDIHTGPAGADGADGKSAYELAVEEGYTGTEEEWLASLHGADGTDGTDGTDGKSAYEIAVDEGFVGTEEQWLASLKGEQGNTGSSVDYPYELVNNRTTDDATKGLSAAEGKRLGDDLSQLEAEVGDISDLQTQDTSNVVAAINEVAARHGFPTNAAELLVSILRRAVYTTDDVKADIDALEEEIVIYNLASISAVFTPGDKTFYVTESVEDLRPYLVVKAVYEDETEETINDYTLHGAFVDGTGTITIKYHGKSTTISVTAEDAVYYRDTFVNKLQLAYKWTTSTRHPATIDGVVYYFTRIAYSGQPTPNRRSSYYLFDLDLVAGKTYDFLFKIDGLSNDAIVSTGLQFHDATLKAAGIANEYEASANYESHINDSTWQLLTLDNGYYTKRYTCPSGMVGVRPCLKLGSDDTTTWPDDAIVKEFIIKEVSNE